MTWHIYNAVPTGKFTKSGKPIKRWPDKPTHTIVEGFTGSISTLVEQEAQEHECCRAVKDGGAEEIVSMVNYSARKVML
jgi:hypothetical protein